VAKDSRGESARGEPTGAAVAAFLGSALRGESGTLRELVPFPNAKPFSLSFYSAETAAGVAAPPAGAAVVARPSAAPSLAAAGYAVVESEHPKYDVARVYEAFFAPPAAEGVHPSAVVGEGVSLGRGVAIGPGCVLDGAVDVADGARLGANVRVKGPARIGPRVEIGSSAVIGEAAFSYGFGPDGAAARFPATGGVVLEEDVEIGPCTFVAAGIFDATHIEAGAKLADLVSISNAVRIGRNTIVTARVAVSGRARIGAGCWLGQSCAVRQGVTVGDGAQVGMGAVVVKDVPAGMVVLGNPAAVKRPR